MAGTKRDPIKRFWKKVSIDVKTGCWMWQGCPNGAGYGVIMVNGRTVKVHRFAYETFIGPIPDDLEIGHKCDVKACCNPAHLSTITHAQNVQEAWDRGLRKRKTRRQVGIQNAERIVELLRDTDQTYYEIADAFGIGYMTVVHINSGFHWADAHPEVARPIRNSFKQEAA